MAIRKYTIKQITQSAVMSVLRDAMQSSRVFSVVNATQNIPRRYWLINANAGRDMIKGTGKPLSAEASTRYMRVYCLNTATRRDNQGRFTQGDPNAWRTLDTSTVSRIRANGVEYVVTP